MKSAKKPSKSFDEMAPWERRTAIARDALEQLEAGKLEPAHIYCEFNSKFRSLKAAIASKSTTCAVCAIGALLVAKVDLNGDFQPNHRGTVGPSEIHVHLRDEFGSAELRLIESYYEGFTSPPGAWRFKQAMPSSEDRMRTILRNIVRNRGRFHPLQLPFRATS